MKRIFAVAVLSLAATTAAFASTSATATATGTAIFVRPLSITKTADLGLGIVVIGNGGNVHVTTDGVLYPNNVAVLPGNVSAARFTVNGEPNYSYSIILPSSAPISNGTDTLHIDNFQSMPSGASVLPASGTEEIAVGADVTFDPNQAPGTYTGTFNVTVMY